MQVELKAIQAEVGITFVVVTHDQEEALTMSDRIAVLRDGRIEQVGAPAEVYERPANPFVAGFVGTSIVLAGRAAAELVGEPGTFTVRPEKIHLLDPDAEAPPGHCRAGDPPDRQPGRWRRAGRAPAEPVHHLGRGGRARRRPGQARLAPRAQLP